MESMADIERPEEMSWKIIGKKLVWIIVKGVERRVIKKKESWFTQSLLDINR